MQPLKYWYDFILDLHLINQDSDDLCKSIDLHLLNKFLTVPIPIIVLPILHLLTPADDLVLNISQMFDAIAQEITRQKAT